jgi:hypothetical protein
MNKPWTDGPHELIQHAIDHLALGSDFDRRIAFISIDNAVELMTKTYLGLPERARGSKGPSRKELEQASESFPDLLSLLETFAGPKITALNLDDIEWYHRLRNQLYHSGNGITVDRSKVEAYLQLSSALFECLFDSKIITESTSAAQTKTGEFLFMWNDFQRQLRQVLPPKEGELALHWKLNFLEKVDPTYARLYEELSQFRNGLIHGLTTPDPKVIETAISQLRQLLSVL